VSQADADADSGPLFSFGSKSRPHIFPSGHTSTLCTQHMPVHTTHSSLETQRYSNGHEQARQVARKTRRIQYVCTVPSRCSSTDRGRTAWIGQPAHRTPQPVVLTLGLGCPERLATMPWQHTLHLCWFGTYTPQHDSGLLGAPERTGDPAKTCRGLYDTHSSIRGVAEAH